MDDEHYVIMATKAQCCAVGGATLECLFVEGRDELLDKMIHSYGHYGGDNYSVHSCATRDEFVRSYGDEDSGDESWANLLKRITNWPCSIIFSAAAPELAYDDEKLLSLLEGDCGDWSLSCQAAADCDDDDKRRILKAEGCLPKTIDEAFEALW